MPPVRMIFPRPTIVAALLLLAPHAWGGLRLAIVARDDDSQPFAEAVASGLAATHKEVELAGKDEIAAALKAHALPVEATAAQELDFAKALHAQGVLILDVAADAAKPVMRARLFSAQQGVTLFDSTAAFAQGQTPWLSGLIEGRVAKLLPKLGNEPGKLEPVAIGEIGEVNATAGLGTWAAALVRSRFAAEPGVIMGEPLGLDLLSPENPPADDASKTYWSKPWTVDGSIDAGSKPGTIALHLRLHGPDGAAVKTFTAEGEAATLKDLVAQAAGDALKDLGQPASAAWDPDAEARDLVDDTVWAKNLGQFPTATVMAEEACALSRDTLNEAVFLRAWLYLQHANSWRTGPADYRKKDLPLPERYAAMTKAVEACQKYLDGHFTNTGRELEMKYMGQMRYDVIRTNVTSTASEILAELIDAPSPDGPAAEPLRQALRKLEPFDPRAGKLPGERWEIAYFASYWADNQDELIDYYCASLLSDEDWQKTIATDSVWRFVKFREGIFNSIGAHGYAMAQQGNVSSMDSPPPGPSRYADAAGAFNKLTEKLAANPRTRVVAYFIRSTGKAPIEERQAWFGKCLDEFWDRREELLKEGRFADWLDDVMELDPEVRSEYSDRQVKLLRYFLVNGGKCWDYFFKSLWNPAAFPPDQAGDIWKEFNAYRQRLGGNTDWLEPYAKTFLDQFPAYKTAAVPVASGSSGSAAAQGDDVMVATGWHPYGGAGAASEGYTTLGATLTEGRLWVWGRYINDPDATLLSFDLDTFKVRLADISPPDVPGDYRNFPLGVVVAPDAFYVSNGNPPDTSTVSRYDRQAKTWETRKLPGGAMAEVGGQLYLNLNGRKDNVFLAGLARYDWSTGKITYLVQSHRKPALNQFDSAERFFVSGIFEGPARKIVAMMGGAPYYVREEAGDWQAPEAQPDLKGIGLSASALDGKVLLFSALGDSVYYCDPAANTLDMWVSPDGKGLWDPAPERAKYERHVPNVHFGLAPGGFMWVDPVPDTKDRFAIRWFRRGGPRAGERLTLQLKSDNAPDPKPFGYISGGPTGATPSSAINTEKGLVIWNGPYGYWFIPYADIEAYLKKSK